MIYLLVALPSAILAVFIIAILVKENSNLRIRQDIMEFNDGCKKLQNKDRRCRRFTEEA